MASLLNSLGLLNCDSPCCGHKLQIPAASRCLLGGPSATCAGSAGTSGSWWPRWQKCCPEIQQPAQTLRQSAPWYLWVEKIEQLQTNIWIITVNFIHMRHLFTHQWHRKASGQISASPSILCIDSSSRQTISARCTPPQRPRWSRFPALQTTALKLTTYPRYAACGARVYMQNYNTHQDVQGTLRAVFKLFNGGKDREDETGKDQEESKRKEKKGY